MVNYETHYRYTGDKAFLDRWFDQLQGAVGWFESHTGADGLFDVPGDAGGHWGYANSGKESYDNALYVYALAHAARAAEAEGRADLAADWRAKAARTAAGDQRHAVTTAGLRRRPGRRTPRPGRQRDGAARRRRHGRPRRRRAALPGRPDGPLRPADGRRARRRRAAVREPVHHVLPARHRRHRHRAIGLLRRTWSPMLRGDTTGTFLENVSTAGGPQLGSYTSYSHGWAAAPTSYLTTKVLGVEPDGAGFSSFTVTPQPGSLQCGRGRRADAARDDRRRLEAHATAGCACASRRPRARATGRPARRHDAEPA